LCRFALLVFLQLSFHFFLAPQGQLRVVLLQRTNLINENFLVKLSLHTRFALLGGFLEQSVVQPRPSPQRGNHQISNNPGTHREFFFFNAVSSDSLVRNASTALDLPSSASFNRSSNWNTFSAISRS
jgi:hypothetical protein